MRIIDAPKGTNNLLCCQNSYHLFASQYNGNGNYALDIFKILGDGTFYSVYYADSISSALYSYANKDAVYFCHHGNNYNCLLFFKLKDCQIIAVDNIPDDTKLVTVKYKYRLYSTKNYCVVTKFNDQLGDGFRSFVSENLWETYFNLRENEFFVFNKNLNTFKVLQAPCCIVSSAIISQDENTCAMILYENSHYKVAIFDLVDF